MESFSDKLFNALKSSDPNEQIAALNKLQDDIANTPEHVSAKTAESALHMANTQLAYQITVADGEASYRDANGASHGFRFENHGSD